MNIIKFFIFSITTFFLLNITLADTINYQVTKFDNDIREFKSNVRGIRGIRGIRGLRGACSQIQDNFALRLLVPKNTGKTLLSSPTLYWWISQPLENAEFVLIIDKLVEDGDFEFVPPLFKKTVKMSVSEGIQSFPIHDFKLTSGVKYQVSLSISCHIDYPSLDIIAAGSIMQVVPSNQLTTELTTSSKDKWPTIYAKHGIWYDALDELSKQIINSKNSSQLRRTRVELLHQVGLQTVVSAESK